MVACQPCWTGSRVLARVSTTLEACFAIDAVEEPPLAVTQLFATRDFSASSALPACSGVQTLPSTTRLFRTRRLKELPRIALISASVFRSLNIRSCSVLESVTASHLVEAVCAPLGVEARIARLVIITQNDGLRNIWTFYPKRVADLVATTPESVNEVDGVDSAPGKVAAPPKSVALTATEFR
jgi:hypothetical protein